MYCCPLLKNKYWCLASIKCNSMLSAKKIQITQSSKKNNNKTTGERSSSSQLRSCLMTSPSLHHYNTKSSTVFSTSSYKHHVDRWWMWAVQVRSPAASRGTGNAPRASTGPCVCLWGSQWVDWVSERPGTDGCSEDRASLDQDTCVKHISS